VSLSSTRPMWGRVEADLFEALQKISGIILPRMYGLGDAFCQRLEDILGLVHLTHHNMHAQSLVGLFNIIPSEVRALPMRHCRQAAWQTKWPLNSFFFSSSLFLRLITFFPEGVVLGS
jgi:hypothetical protein